MEYQDEFETACEYARQSLPVEAHGAAQWSLYYGPSGGGASMSWRKALNALSEWADSVESVTLYEYAEDENGVECEIEAGYIDACAIVKAIVGAELAHYI